MKLHLGCGKRRISLPGYINVDIDPANEPDIVCDVREFTGEWLQDVEVIYACHVLEHCGRHECKDVLKRWHALLVPGGVLRLSVPDFTTVVSRYLDEGDLTELLGFLYGGQRDANDYHKMGWDEHTLTRDLFDAGFREVRRYDRDKTEHADVDDYSNARLPHIRDCKDMAEYNKGTLLSLNLECIK